MSGRKQSVARIPTSTSATDGKAKEGSPEVKKKQSESMRETVEAIAIAFVLAFVFKTFQAEAYVIPTGSMAPTLFGRHKEAVCEACQYQFPVGASQEIDQDSGIVIWRIEESECPNCRFTNNIRDAPVFNGDRILVNKQVHEYRRFDVVVFKNPEEPHVNYIKRLVGLPGEIVRVRQGDIYARKDDKDPWRIQRKDDAFVQKDIQLLVYDDRYPPIPLLEAGGEERWVPAALNSDRVTDAADEFESEVIWSAAENSWQPDRDSREYRTQATSTEPDNDTEANNSEQLSWLRYRHLVPSEEDWAQAISGRVERQIQPSLVVDFCGFNSFAAAGGQLRRDRYNDGLFWVGDLTMNLTVDIESIADNPLLVLELVEGFRWYQCRINPSTGDAEVILINRLIGQENAAPELLTSVQTPLQGPGSYEVTFANVDDRLCLWIDDELVPLGEAAEFDLSSPAEATGADLTPAGIASRGWTGTVSNLVLQRDLYYRDDTIDFSEDRGTTHDPFFFGESPLTGEIPQEAVYKLATLIRSPSRYSNYYLDLVQQQHRRLNGRGDYVLSDDEYLMFGDNSPASKDSRLFDYNSRPLTGRGGHRYAVQKQDLIGEALFVFWPHGIPFLNGGHGYSLMNHKERRAGGIVRGDYPVYRAPFYPNISRMKRIR